MYDHLSQAAAAPVRPSLTSKIQSGSSLDWLVDPTGKEAFFNEYWERCTLVVHRNQPNYFSSLLSMEEVDRVLTTLGRRYPDVVLKNAERNITAADYTTDGATLDLAQVAQLFAEGCTITLAYLDTVLPQLTRLCRKLESDFSCPFQANVYVTPPLAQGARPHYDTHDVFVLQVAGSKRWTIFDTPVELPLSGQDFDPTKHAIGSPTMEFTLRAGDVAYVPRGVAHEAKSTDETSLHITAGVLRYTWVDLLLEVVAGAALGDPVLRRALPPDFARSSFDRTRAREEFRALLKRVAAREDFDAALDHFADNFLTSCPPLLQGQLLQAADMDRLNKDSVVGARDTAIFRMETTKDAVVLCCADRRIRFPERVKEAVCFALHQPHFRVRELPGQFDDESKSTLVRRLAIEGLLRVIAY